VYFCVCVSSDHFDFCCYFCWFWYFQYRAKRLAGKNVSEMTYFVSSGKLNLAPSCRVINWTAVDQSKLAVLKF